MTDQVPIFNRAEQSRLDELRRLRILDTLPEETFDRITRVAAGYYRVPISIVTLVDEHRQWFKACIGLDMRETDRRVSFCAHAIQADEPMVVPDATLDDRFRDNPLVTGHPGIRFYAGAPIRMPGGQRLGSVCIIDSVPREMQPADLWVLRDLAALAADELELRALRTWQAQADMLLDRLPDAVFGLDNDLRISSMNTAALRLAGLSVRDLGRELNSVVQVRFAGEPLTDPEPRSEDRAAARTALAENRSWNGHLRLVLAHGEEIGVQVHLQPVLDAQSARLGLLATVRPLPG